MFHQNLCSQHCPDYIFLELLLIKKTGRKLQNHCVQLKLHWRHLWQMDKIHHIHQGLVSQQERTLGSQPVHLVIFTCKDTIAPGSVDYQLKMLNFKLYFYMKARLVLNLINLQYFTVTVIGIEYCFISCLSGPLHLQIQSFNIVQP